MKENFCDYTQSLALKQLGFNEECLEYYNSDTEEFCDIIKEVSAPLKQQCFKFFRNKFKLHCTITSISQESWQYHITAPGQKLGELFDKDFESFEQAENEAINKLIEICNELTTKLFKSIHGAVVLNELIKTTKNNIYINPNNLLEKEIYFDGYNYLNTSNFLIMTPDKITECINYYSDKVTEYLSIKDYLSLFDHLDKKVLIPIYIRDFEQIPDKIKYDCFIKVYQRSECGFEQFTPEFINTVFSFAIYSYDRIERLNKLKKNEYLIYHGINYTYNPHDDYSWTLSKKVAKWFAYRFGGKGEVISKIIKINDIIDYLTSRDEEEILIKI